jgi:hypothetical protein
VRLEEIAGLPLEHYNRNAEDIREGTRDHDPPFAILDFGCGPGRDLKAFAVLGHIAVGPEGAARLAPWARAEGGAECRRA